GATLGRLGVRPRRRVVSIRAPARGATWVVSACVPVDALFQSAPLREGRRDGAGALSGGCNGFNPRPCARGDTDHQWGDSGVQKFQSAPLREGRPCIWLPAEGDPSFQSAPLREGRRVKYTELLSGTGFNPRPCA